MVYSINSLLTDMWVAPKLLSVQINSINNLVRMIFQICSDVIHI